MRDDHDFDRRRNRRNGNRGDLRDRSGRPSNDGRLSHDTDSYRPGTRRYTSSQHFSLPPLTLIVHANLASDVYAVVALLPAPVMREMADTGSRKKVPLCAHATGAEAEAATLVANGNPAANAGLTIGPDLPIMGIRLPEAGNGLKIHLRDIPKLCLLWATTGGPMLSTRPPIHVKDRSCPA
jgi:hypothetical protein